MLLYLKFRKDIDGFTQSEVNTLPIPTHAVGIIAELSVSFFMDRYNRRLSLGFILCTIQIICSIVLLIPNMTVAGNLTALYLSASAYGINPLLYGWASNILARTADDAARSVTLASMTASDGLLWTFWGIVLFPADDAPYWRNGYIGMLCVSTVLAGWLFVVRWVSSALMNDGCWLMRSSLIGIRLRNILLVSVRVFRLWLLRKWAILR